MILAMPGKQGPVPPGIADDVEAAIDALYQAPLSGFVTERNRLARALKPRDRDAARRIQALAKPSVSAWAVNQAYWRARPAFDALLDAGEALRALQQRAAQGQEVTDLPAASRRLADALAPVASAARDALAQAGHGTGPQIMRRVLVNLQAVAAHGRATAGPRPGRLAADAAAPGFDLLAALAPAWPEQGAAQEPGPAPDPRDRHAARARVADAHAAVETCHRALLAAESDEQEAHARLEAAAAALVEARATLERAAAARAQAAEARAQAIQATARARRALHAAQADLETAEKALAALD